MKIITKQFTGALEGHVVDLLLRIAIYDKSHWALKGYTIRRAPDIKTLIEELIYDSQELQLDIENYLKEETHEISMP